MTKTTATRSEHGDQRREVRSHLPEVRAGCAAIKTAAA
jgi:hypothetical protein